MTQRPTPFLPRERLNDLFNCLSNAGYQILAPTEQSHSIQYQLTTSPSTLPQGVIDHQTGGASKLEQTSSTRCFSWTTPEQSLKPQVFHPTETLWQSLLGDDQSVSFKQTLPTVAPTLVFGVKSCDLAALRMLDQHFLLKQHPDPHYQARREQLTLFAIHCHRSGKHCFCNDTDDGPAVNGFYNAVMSELDNGYVFHHLSPRMHTILADLNLHNATDKQIQQSLAETESAKSDQKTRLPAQQDIQLYNKETHPAWDKVAEHCLSCGNCTQVCPTCFCYRTQQDEQLDGKNSQQIRQWDSCFTPQHSYIHGIYVRPEGADRYRQWLTHKFTGWQQQFGRIGCTGCGRCLTYCPVGIDPTQVIANLLKPENPA